MMHNMLHVPNCRCCKNKSSPNATDNSSHSPALNEKIRTAGVVVDVGTPAVERESLVGWHDCGKEDFFFKFEHKAKDHDVVTISERLIMERLQPIQPETMAETRKHHVENMTYCSPVSPYSLTDDYILDGSSQTATCHEKTTTRRDIYFPLSRQRLSSSRTWPSHVVSSCKDMHLSSLPHASPPSHHPKLFLPELM